MKEVKLPAVTLCFKFTVSTMQFCNDNPDWCVKPNISEEFCQKHRFHCKGDTSNLTIPVFKDNIENYRRFLRERKNYLFNDTLIYPYKRYFGNALETRTFQYYGGFIYTCYSRNLHLYQTGSKPETREINFNARVVVEMIEMDLHRIELFNSLRNPQVFLGIHSPFIPINAVFNGHAIRTGYVYTIDVRLEREEHLLPPPYQTNCQDNGPSKDVKNFTNPNSYEVCLEMCESELEEYVYNCVLSKTMHSSQSDFCIGETTDYNISFERERELKERRDSCSQNCRPECLKLHYNYKVNEAEHEETDDLGTTYIDIHFKNGEFTSIRHVPLYGQNGAMFSHIGGLLGYWLGISVFTFLDIIEKCFGAAIIWRRRFKKHKAQKTPNSEDLV